MAVSSPVHVDPECGCLGLLFESKKADVETLPRIFDIQYLIISDSDMSDITTINQVCPILDIKYVISEIKIKHPSAY